VVVNPVDGLCDVADDGFHVDVRQDSVVRGDEDIPFVHEGLRLGVHARFVTHLPAAAMDPEDHRQVLCVLRRVDIEHLTFVRGLGVRNVAIDVLGMRHSHESEGDEEIREFFHVRMRFPSMKSLADISQLTAGTERFGQIPDHMKKISAGRNGSVKSPLVLTEGSSLILTPDDSAASGKSHNGGPDGRGQAVPVRDKLP
jgi:hypothetical protein